MQIKNKKYVLSIAYNNYQTGIGGVDRAVMAQKEKLCQNQISYVFVFPQLARVKKQYVLAHLWEVIADDRNLGLYTTYELLNGLWNLQENGYQLQSITIHHLLNIYFPDLYLLLDSIKGKIQMMVHDFYTICPQCFLLKNDKKFCGEDGYQKEKCWNCKSYPEVKSHVQKMRQFFNRYLEMTELIFPSEYAKQLWSKAYSGMEIEKKVVPHLILSGAYQENMEEIKEETSIKIAYIGQQLYLKGWNVWKELYSDKNLKNGYTSYYIGVGKHTEYTEKVVRVSFQKDGKDAMLRKLRNLKMDCVVLWSICPETYSYAYYECLAANVFVITNRDSGNIAAMVGENGNGEVLNNAEELEKAVGNPSELKKRINQWRAEKRLGPQILSDNSALFETEYPEAEIMKIVALESKIGKRYKKILVKIVKWLKKFLIKWFY